MPHLTARFRCGFAIEMQFGAGLVQDLAPQIDFIADEILHLSIGVTLRRAQRQAADRANELLELASDTGIHGPMTGVMRACCKASTRPTSRKRVVGTLIELKKLFSRSRS